MILLILGLIAIAVLLLGAVFMGVWNLFVFQHLAGVHKVSYGAAILVAVAIASLTGASSAK